MTTAQTQAERASPLMPGPPVGINRLPPEALSEIFTVCNRAWRPSYGNRNAFECQTLIPSVCNRWRKIALDTTALWTRITLSDPVPWRFSELCLSRSGPTALLDIVIDMTEDFWARTRDRRVGICTKRAEDAFKFIVKHGGVSSRWRSFSIISDIFLAQLAAMKFLGKSRFPSLKLFEMRFTAIYNIEEDDMAYVEALESPSAPLFQESPPQLCCAKLQGIPPAYLFGHSLHPQFIALTYLELRFEGVYPGIWDFSKMLSANPSLETLVLYLQTEEFFGPREDMQPAKVHLPNLKSVSFLRVPSSTWAFQAISMLDVPNITSLELGVDAFSFQLDDPQTGAKSLLDHIIGADHETTRTPRFPSLEHLTFSSWEGFQYMLERLLATYPRIKSLALPDCLSLDPLLQQPWLAPNLEQLKLEAISLTQLIKVVKSRCNAGLPLRTVLIGLDLSEPHAKIKSTYQNQLKEYVDIVFVDSQRERRGDD